jgi:uncharacterized phage protein gp47/JayE
MADYIEPTKTAFNNAEQVAIDVLSQAAPNLITKTGSVIRELIIRPAAYLLSWITGNINNDIKQYSVSYLKTSQLTDNPVADMVASNYFVTRKQGTQSQGIITMTLTNPVLRIAAGARFTVSGTAMCTPVQYLVTNDADSRQDTDNLVYIKSIPFGNNYIANIPVVAVNPGKVEIPVGSDVAVNFSCATLVDAELTSPVTGGTDTETDAQLMTRAEYNTAEAGIGTYYGIKKKMAKAPVNVPGISVIAGEDKPLFRARHNSVNVNPGGYVDCHVKTCNQAIVKTVTKEITPTLSNGVYNCSMTITGADCAGFIMVQSVLAGGSLVDTFAVEYGSSDITTNAEGARLSVSQTATITFTGTGYTLNEGKLEVSANLVYMPSIAELQAYMDKDTEHFIGQDIKVKAAVPVNLRLDFNVQSANDLTEDDLNGIKQAVVDYVNNTAVGVGVINFSDIRTAVIVSFPNIDLRLPCTMSGEVYTTDGHIDSFYSTAGVLDITKSANANYWGYQVCFFSSCLDNVRLNVL